MIFKFNFAKERITELKYHASPDIEAGLVAQAVAAAAVLNAFLVYFYKDQGTKTMATNL